MHRGQELKRLAAVVAACGTALRAAAALKRNLISSQNKARQLGTPNTPARITRRKAGRGARLLNEPRSVHCRRGLSTTAKIEGARQAHFQHLPISALFVRASKWLR
jgi:hypothetical protein